MSLTDGMAAINLEMPDRIPRTDSMLKIAFKRRLDELNECFDDSENLLLVPFDSPGYHTTFRGETVHPTRESLAYAVALLDSGREEYTQRAAQILRKVISLQDTNPDNATYGCWPWFYEEPLEKMSPPDANWTDFCSKLLLQVAIDHFHRLGADLREDIKSAIKYACDAIILRNVGPGYTNISLMGTYVTFVAGELFNDREVLEYAKNRLRELHRYNMENGEFSEYNSPTYTVVAIEEISAMLKHIKDKNSLDMVEDLNEIAWGCMARHFHVPTHQWSGPHSRCYDDLLPRKVLSLIQIATKGSIVFMDISHMEIETAWVRIKLKCPEKFYTYFNTISLERIQKKIFNSLNGHGLIDMENCYLTDKYVLSSFYHSDLWNQRRPLISYFGTPERPVFMRLRCLHNGYDYCSGHLLSVQDKGRVLGVVNFFTDGGDTHPYFNMLDNGTIKARDLRIRLELGGGLNNSPVFGKRDKTSFYIRLFDICIYYHIIDAVFGENQISYEIFSEEQKLWIDVILYKGQEKEINFNHINKAFLAFMLKIETDENGEKAIESITAIHNDDKVRVEAKGEKSLLIEAPAKALPFSDMAHILKGCIDNVPYGRSAL